MRRMVNSRAFRMTPGAEEAIADAGHDPMHFIRRHVFGDWGDVSPDDKRANDEAMRDGGRVLSAFVTAKGVKLWVITEGTDDDGLRAATTILLPEEY